MVTGAPFPFGGINKTSSGVSSRRASWLIDGYDWALQVDDAKGVLVGELVAQLPTDSPVTVLGEGLIESWQNGRTLTVAFARWGGGGSTERIRLEVFNTTGQVVRTLVDGMMVEGLHSAR